MKRAPMPREKGEPHDEHITEAPKRPLVWWWQVLDMDDEPRPYGGIGYAFNREAAYNEAVKFMRAEKARRASA